MIAMATLAIVAPAAQASPSDADCPGGYVCIFTDGNFGGEVFYVPDGGSIDHLQDYHCGGCVSSAHPESNGTYDNMMSSWKNFSGRQYCWSFNPDKDGERHDMPNGVRVGQVAGRENDQASSLFPC